MAASNATHTAVLLAGVAGLVAGAMSMAAGEYVSVSSQSDTERADIERERTELAGRSMTLTAASPVNIGSSRFIRSGKMPSNGLKIRCPKGRAGSTPALGP